MPDANFHHQATTSAPPDTVWSRLQDPATWAHVAGADSTRDHLHDGNHLTSFTFLATVAGVSYRGDARVVAAMPEEEMTLGIQSREVAGEITVRLEPTPAGTNLMVHMRMRPNGLVGAMAFPAVSGAVSNGFAASVERLASSVG